MSVQSEVPILVCKLDIESIIELWSNALSCHVSVRLGYLSVIIPVDEFVLYRIAVLIIFLLICVVCVWSISDHLTTQEVASSAGNATGLYIVSGIIGSIEFCKSGILECAVEANHQIPFGSLYRHSCEGELQSLVPDGTDICHQLIAEIRTHRDLYGVQKILCITQICIHAAFDSLPEESEIDTHIICYCSLPFNGRIVCLRSQHIVITYSHIILMERVISEVVSGEMNIVTYAVLLTCLADRHPEFQF